MKPDISNYPLMVSSACVCIIAVVYCALQLLGKAAYKCALAYFMMITVFVLAVA